MKLRTFTTATGLIVLGLIASTAAFAAPSKAELNAGATKALRHFYALNPMNRQLAKKAAGVLVFEHVTKGGIGVAGEHGDGVLRVEGNAVDYYSIGAASVGLTLGLGEHSEIIMFMSQEALDKFTNSQNWSVGADTAVAVVSAGAGGKYDSDTLNKPILGFVYGEKGLLGDLSFEGAKVTKIGSGVGCRNGWWNERPMRIGESPPALPEGET
jgi:lipid-binding SYLF domain-containing protein